MNITAFGKTFEFKTYVGEAIVTQPTWRMVKDPRIEAWKCQLPVSNGDVLELFLAHDYQVEHDYSCEREYILDTTEWACTIRCVGTYLVWGAAYNMPSANEAVNTAIAQVIKSKEEAMDKAKAVRDQVIKGFELAYKEDKAQYDDLYTSLTNR